MNTTNHSKSQESTRAIERLYITMRHLFNRGFYKPGGVSGKTLRESLLFLRPEIYGSIADEKTELNGLIYVIERLPEGIEECQFINLTAEEGFKNSHFKAIIPPKRRRNCYRIDSDQMNIEITRGRSEIYDILTHLTFLFVESHKIKDRILIDEDESTVREWNYLQDVVINNKEITKNELEVLLTHIATILGRTFDEVRDTHKALATAKNPNKLFNVVFWLGHLALKEELENSKRTVTFSSTLRDSIGRHIYGEIWANNIKEVLEKQGIINRPIHIVSANMHSVMNSIYASMTLTKEAKANKGLALFELLSEKKSEPLQRKVKTKASKNGLIYIKDTSGANINVQVIDTSKIDFSQTTYTKQHTKNAKEMPIIIVMDYAFGEQAFETMDELLKPYICKNNNNHFMNVKSVSIMGKAGILEGGKSDIMIPSAHIFEGTADNYPFKNELKKGDLEGYGVDVYEGSMVTVLGTSLQNKDILEFFHDSTWRSIGLEMEGAHYQKAIQSASKIRGNISENVKVRYAYYASDNPLETGSTLASGGLGTSGVRPTYLITRKILEQIF